MVDEGESGPQEVGPWLVHTVPLGEPPVAALQLAFEPGETEPELAQLAPFAVGAALALRRSRRVSLIALALKRSQTLVAVVSQAIAQLSLTHTLETAVDRVAELTSSGHVGIYLQEGSRLVDAASRNSRFAHRPRGARLELALGPFRSRGFLFIEDMKGDPRLSGLDAALDESGVRRALFIPLLVRDEVIGALGVFKTRPRPYREGEEGLLIALSSQLAVAVQNARLHERTKELSAILEQTLDSERRAARQLRGLYEISQSFTESLSLDATLEAVARTMVGLLDADVAVIRMPDPRTGGLTARAVHVANPRLADVVEALAARPQPLSAPLARELLEAKGAVVLRSGMFSPDDAHRVLEPFLRRGASAAVLPLATPGEVLGTLTIVCFDPTRPLEADDIDVALAVGAQAALAIDNARLYQQQKDFAETMQRSLLPRELPKVMGLDVGHVYQSAARVDVGGDLYDFVELEDGRLAVAVGDVLARAPAAADMAMTNFSFRSCLAATPAVGVLSEPKDVSTRHRSRSSSPCSTRYQPVRRRAALSAPASAGEVCRPVLRVRTLGVSAPARDRADQEYPRARRAQSPGWWSSSTGRCASRRGSTAISTGRSASTSCWPSALPPAQAWRRRSSTTARRYSVCELSDDCALVLSQAGTLTS